MSDSRLRLDHIGIAVESLMTLWEGSEHEEWQNRLCLIPSLVMIAVGDR